MARTSVGGFGRSPLSPAMVEAAYRADVGPIAQARLATACLVVIGLFALDGLYQAVARAAAFRQDFWIRIGAVALLGGIVAITRRPRSFGVVRALVVAVVAIVAVDVETAMVALGTSGAAFLVGLVLVVVAAGMLFPFGPRTTLGFAAVVWAVFAVPFAAGHVALPARQVGDQAFLLACGTVVAVLGSYLTEALRRKEITAREALRAETDRSEWLLRNVLPDAIAERLKAGDHTIAEYASDASVLFADIVGFTPLSETMTPEALVALLDEVFTAFDNAAAARGLEKIKTIGDAYMVAAGVPVPREDHLEAIVDMALEIRRVVAEIAAQRGLRLAVRIGIHAGPVVAGVIGTAKFSYDVWGDTVNTASRMESHGEPGEIHVTDEVRRRLATRYEFTEPRVVKIKGKGELTTCFLVRKCADQPGGE